MTEVFYDPDRMATLYVRADEAARDLASITSQDPAAGDAVVTARTSSVHLTATMLPLIRMIAESDALLSFVLSGLSGGAGPDLGRSLLALAVDILERDDDDAVVALRTALELAGRDRVAMHTFFTGLGGDGVAELLLALGEPDDDDDMEHQLELAVVVRDGLASTTRVSSLPGAFARDLVARMVAAADDEHQNGAIALSFLFDDATFDTGFLVAATESIVDAELSSSPEAPEDGFMLWFATMQMRGPGSVLARALDEEADAGPTSELYRGGDPMYAVMESVARNGEAGRQLFIQAPIAEYLFAQRSWMDDGFRSIADAAETATTGPAVGPGADRKVVDQASTIASAFVNRAGSRGHVMLDDRIYANADVTASVAEIIGAHMSGVKFSLANPEGFTDLGGAVLDVPDDSFGANVHVALFDRESLEVMTDVAVDDEHGVATIRAALDIFHADYAARAVPNIDTFETRDAFVAEAMLESASLEAFFIERAGHRAEVNGRAADRVVTMWVDLASFGADKAAGATGPFAPIITTSLGPIADAITDELATHEAAARRDAEAYAERAARQITYVWYKALYDHGVLVPAILEDLGVAVNGELISWSAFNELDEQVRIRARAVLENSTGSDGFNLDTSTVIERIKTEQLDLYQQLL
ncbi:MAG: DUF6571 family protein [Ilumatobacteraceae bacterium]